MGKRSGDASWTVCDVVDEVAVRQELFPVYHVLAFTLVVVGWRSEGAEPWCVLRGGFGMFLLLVNLSFP